MKDLWPLDSTIMPDTLHTLSHLILRIILKGRYYFRDEKKKKKENKLQGDIVPGLRSHSGGTI